jgi:LysM repeat protein
LYAIARTYNLKVADLRAWNNLKDDKIMLCSKLSVVAPVVVPKSVPIPYSTVVKPKLAGPKVVFKAAPRKVVAMPKATKVIEKPRPIEPFIANTITVTAKSVPTKQTASFVKKGAGLRVVKKGETVAALAKETKMTEAEFRRLNNLTKSETISVGQVLRTENCACNVAVDPDHALILKPIPVSNELIGDVPTTYNTVVKPKNTEGSQLTAKSVDLRASRKYHVVQQNETLTSIAKMYKKTVENIRSLNRLEEHEVIVPSQLLMLE